MEETKEEENNFEVVVRCQPLIQRPSYQSRGIKQEQALFIDQSRNTITVQLQNQQQEKEEKLLHFQKIISPNQSQMEVYQSVAYPMVESLFQGFSSTIIAYGQTGSGKTYTMQGEYGSEQSENRGFIFRAVDQIFEHIENNPQIQYILRVSIFSIYNENIEDMLLRSNDKLKIRENKQKEIYVEDLTESVVVNKQQMIRVIKEGEQTRQIADTYMGRISSRCDKIVQFKIQSYDQSILELKIGILSFVTMKGSERIAKTGYNFGLQEQMQISKGINTFGMVINYLAQPEQKHIPYRDSKLTRLLQNSLGGNAKTVLLATVAPDQLNQDETLSTLRFAVRASKVKNRAKINIITDPEKIQYFKDEYQKINSNRTIFFKNS